MWDKIFQRRLKRIERRGERQKAKQEMIDKYAEYYPSKRRKVSNVMLVVVVSAITIYTVASFWLTYATGMSIDSTLTTCFYAFMSSELIALASIKCSKVIKSKDDSFCEENKIDNDDEVVG